MGTPQLVYGRLGVREHRVGHHWYRDTNICTYMVVVVSLTVPSRAILKRELKPYTVHGILMPSHYTTVLYTIIVSF